MYVTAIVLSAGRGKRFFRRMSRSKNPGAFKTLVEINRKPVIIYCLETLSRHPLVKDIIIVANTDNSRYIIRKISQYRIGKVAGVVKGGLRRQDSVRNGLKALNSCSDMVLIQDAARPFIDKGLISSVIKAAKESGAAIAGVPVKSTIKTVSKFTVEKTLNRENLWEIQTPQAFKKNLILKAYEKFGNVTVTDDSMLVEKLGATVSVVLSSYSNIKITTPEDLVSAEAIAKEWNTK
ncbi:MAG: 2-C-methyl-D-erythritol 4-phosphate cytidylyltransferase [Candidatus Omnitrophota bacterium]